MLCACTLSVCASALMSCTTRCNVLVFRRYTVHGWFGILTISLFSTNYLGGVVIFANPR